MKLGISILVGRLIMAITILRRIDYPERAVSGSVSTLNFGKCKYATKSRKQFNMDSLYVYDIRFKN